MRFAAGTVFATLLFASSFVPNSCDAAETIPFQTLSTGQLQIIVRMNGAAPIPVLLDLGAGSVVLSAGEAKALNLEPTGIFTGFRMGGVRVDTQTGGPLTLSLQGFETTVNEVGIWDGLDPFHTAALVSAVPFRKAPFTLDFIKQQFTINDAPPHDGAGVERTPLLVDDQRGISLDLFARFDFAPDVSGLCIIDTGSSGLFLNKRFASRLHVDVNDPKLRHIRYDQGDGVVSTVPELAVHGAPRTRYASPHAAFVDMIYDCNVGAAFWKGTRLTFDIPSMTLYIQKPN